MKMGVEEYMISMKETFRIMKNEPYNKEIISPIMLMRNKIL